jgi:hypothetical protein
VDRLGGLEDAVEEAAKMAGLGSRRDVVVVPYSAQGDPGLPVSGLDWARAASPSLLRTLRGELARMEALAEPKLWAISPELAGWIGNPLPGGE